MKRDIKHSGQSLIEIMIGIALTIVFIVGVATVIAPALQIGKETTQAQTKTELASALLDNVRAWAAGNWNNILALATGTANTYYLNTATSSFTVSAISVGGSTSTANIVSVQTSSSSDKYSGGSFLSDSATFSGNTSSGDAIIVSIQYGIGANRVSGCRDTQNVTSTYIKAASAYDSAATQGQDTWYALNITGGTTPTVTCSFTGNTDYIAMAIHEYSGIATSSALDATSTNILTTASTALTTGTSTTNFNNELIFGGFVGTDNGDWTFTHGSGFTTRIDNGTTDGLDTEDEIQSSAGPVSAFATASPGDQQTNIMATFEPAIITTGGGGTTYTTSTELISIGGIIYARSFYLSDVYRDGNGNVTTTATGNSYDPSTKLVTIMVNASSTNSGPTSTLSFYLTRNASNNFNQTSWAGASGQNNPITIATSSFYADSNITISATGSIQLSSGGNSCIL